MLADTHGTSLSSIMRRLREVVFEWVQPPLSDGGFLHPDTSYCGLNWGVLLGLDDVTGKPLYVAFIGHEWGLDYVDAVLCIVLRGFYI